MQSLAEIETKKAELVVSLEKDLKRGGHFAEDAVAFDFLAVAKIKATLQRQGKGIDEVILAVLNELIKSRLEINEVSIFGTIIYDIDPSGRLGTITNSTAAWSGQKTIDQVLAAKHDTVALRSVVLKIPAIDEKGKYLDQTLGQLLRPFLPKFPS